MSRYFTKTLASLEPYTPGEQLKIADIVKLNANENPYPPAIVYFLFVAFIGVNFLVEFAVNAALSAAIARIVQVVQKQLEK